MGRRTDTTRIIVTAASAGTAFVVVAVLFANATTASRVSENARDLHWANATLGTAALARATAGQYVAFSDRPGGDEPAATAEAELVDVTDALSELMSDAPSSFGGDGDALLAALQERPIDLAAVDASYRPFAADLRKEMDGLEAAIDASDATADTLSGVVRLLVTLILPAAAIYVYRRRATRQVQEAELRMDAELAAERQINRAKDQFVAGMSHEIRTPLTGIYGFSELLLESPPDAVADRELVTMINTESVELTRMVDDFIAYSRIDSGSLDIAVTEVDLREVASGVVERFNRRGLGIALGGGSAVAEADAGRVRQILVDLVANAASHGGPRVTVDIDGDGETVRCRVVDDGPGVDPDVEHRLFTRFVHEGADVLVAGSLGLGTWVARRLAEAMDGTVTYERTDRQTSFILSLPAAGNERTPAADHADDAVTV